MTIMDTTRWEIWTSDRWMANIHGDVIATKVYQVTVNYHQVIPGTYLDRTEAELALLMLKWLKLIRLRLACLEGVQVILDEEGRVL